MRVCTICYTSHNLLNFQYFIIDANSKRVKEIEEVLKHEPGALCSFLEIVREAEVSLIIVQLLMPL